MKMALPIGIENFQEIITSDYYYVDKTMMIKELLDLKGKVNLFTRPRRFGKTLNLSMLRCFFEDTMDGEKNACNSKLFDGLKIMDAGETYSREMGQYPVISLTLKSARQSDFETAYYMIKESIASEFQRFLSVIEQGRDAISESDWEKYVNILEERAENKEYANALQFLSKCIYKVTGKKVIILLDEYDVPLENAYFSGFYNKMADFLRSLFESALKTNDNLHLAVITGGIANILDFQRMKYSR